MMGRTREAERQGASGGDEEFGALLVAVLSGLRRLVRALTPGEDFGEEDREDIVVEVCLVAWRERERFGGRTRSEMLLWTSEIARRIVRGLQRARRRWRPLPLEEADGVAASGARPENDAAEVEKREVVRRAIRSLSRADRELLEDIHWRGLSHGEAALKRGVHRSTVSRRLKGIYRRLREELERQSLGGGGG